MLALIGLAMLTLAGLTMVAPAVLALTLTLVGLALALIGLMSNLDGLPWTLVGLSLTLVHWPLVVPDYLTSGGPQILLKQWSSELPPVHVFSVRLYHERLIAQTIEWDDV